MGAAIVLGQDLSEAAGPVRTVCWQIWQRVTGSWVTVTGKRREGDLLIWLLSCQPGRSDRAMRLCRTHSTRHMSKGRALE
jgi:hypothetical protein